MQYKKYKQKCRVTLCGDNDIYTLSNYCYSVGTGGVTNSKRLKFNINGMLNEVKLSNNARFCIESVIIPQITNMTSQVIIIRAVVSTRDKVFDTKKYMYGNPIIFTCTTNSSGYTTFYNGDMAFFNINVPTDWLNATIELELECVSQQTSAIDFITSSPLNNFQMSFIITDEDLEQTQDNNLAPLVNYKTDILKNNFIHNF